MRKIMNKVSIFLFLFIFCVDIKIHLSKDNFLLSSSLTEANSASDFGGAEANSNSDSSVSLSKNSNFLNLEDRNNYKGDFIIGLSDSKSKALTDLGNAKATSTSTASAYKNEIINNDDISNDDRNITNSQDNSDVILAEAKSKSYAASKKGDASSVAVAITNVYDNSSIYKNEEERINHTNIDNQISLLNSDCIEYNWTDLEIAANYISVDAYGILYYLDLGGCLYKFEFVGKRSHKIKTTVDSIDDTDGDEINQDFNYLRNLNKIITGAYNNYLFVISKYGDGYYYRSLKEKWMKIDGCIWDIALNRNGIAYKLGCDYDDNGYTVYRYICDQLSMLEIEKDDPNYFYQFKENDECFWFKLDFRAKKISINNEGTLYFIGIDDELCSFDEKSNNLNKIYTAIKVKDFSISNDGSLFLVGIDHIIYKITINEYEQNDSDIECIKCNASAISVGPINLPFIISENGKVLFSSKFPFN